MIIAVSGLGDDEAARAVMADALALRASSGVERIIFDSRCSEFHLPLESLLARAMACGRELERSRVALICEAMDDPYARLWRKGLVETGHEAMVFTDAAAAEAWLFTSADADMVYLP